MKKLAIITGTSTGIGQALVQTFINEGFVVIGLSRRKVENQENYTHYSVDLSQKSELENFWTEITKTFADQNFDETLLINNAASLGPTKSCSKLDYDEVLHTYQSNVIGLQFCCKHFLLLFKTQSKASSIFNISSGAGRHPYDGWSVYCGTKAAVDMLSECINAEELQTPNPVKILSIAPGVIDTPMQEMIRQSSEVEFSKKERFLSLKQNNELDSPQTTASKLLNVYQQKDRFSEVKIDLRDLV